MLVQLRSLLAGAAFPWAVCGGYALELFAGRSLRPHGDVDLCLPEAARTAAIAFFLAKGWTIFEYRGMGRVKPIFHPQDSEPGRNLMTLHGSRPPVQFYPCEESGLLYHRFTPGMTELNFLDLLFGTVQDRPVLVRCGMPVIAPETALLYKAASPDDASARADFAAVFPLLDDSQQAWLRAALTAKYPDGHPWLNEQE